MYKIEELASTIDKIDIGRRGEHLAREIQFDVTVWLNKWPDATFAINVVRPDEEVPYPVACTLSGNILSWSPDAADTALHGIGRLEINAMSGERLMKSAVVLTQIAKSLYVDDLGVVPEVGQGWLDELARTQSYVEQAVDNVSQSEEDVARMATEIEEGQAELEQRVTDLENWRVMGGGSDGGSVTPEAVQEAVDYYLDKHPVQATPIDSTLTQPNQAADAKVVGDKLNALEETSGLAGITITLTEV